jgi:zinc transporter 1/2/3
VESGASVDHGEYPLPYALVLLGYMAIFLVERVLFHSHAHTLESEDEDLDGTEMHNGHSHGGHGGHGHGHGGAVKSLVAGAPAGAVDAAAPKKVRDGFKKSLVLLFAISLHAILAGVSLGIQAERSKVITVLIAICSHKAPAAFSIGSKFMRNGGAAAQVKRS